LENSDFKKKKYSEKKVIIHEDIVLSYIDNENTQFRISNFPRLKLFSDHFKEIWPSKAQENTVFGMRKNERFSSLRFLTSTVNKCE